MSFPFYITKKYSFSKKDSRFINLISTIAVTGISLGVATLNIALSILNGFEKTLTENIIVFDAHIQINSYKSILSHYKNVLPDLKSELLYPDSRPAEISEDEIKDNPQNKNYAADKEIFFRNVHTPLV